MPKKPAAPGCARIRAKPLLEHGKSCTDSDRAPVDQVVGRTHSPSTFSLFFRYLQRKVAEREGFEPSKGY